MLTTKLTATHCSGSCCCRVAVALPEGWSDLFGETSKWDKGQGRIKYIAAGKAVPPLTSKASLLGGGFRARRMGGWPSSHELLAFMKWCTQVEVSSAWPDGCISRTCGPAT